MKKATLYVSLVLIVILVGILVSCHVFGPEPAIEVDKIADAGNDGNYSRRTDLALIKTQEIHQIGISELSQIVLFAIGDGTGNEWFIMASNDVRVGHILAITHESFADSDTDLATFLRESLNEYVVSKTKMSPAFTNETSSTINMGT